MGCHDLQGLLIHERFESFHNTTKLRLLQIDIAIRDPRADDKTGWSWNFRLQPRKSTTGRYALGSDAASRTQLGERPDLTATSGTMDEGWLNPVAATLLKTTNRPEGTPRAS